MFDHAVGSVSGGTCGPYGMAPWRHMAWHHNPSDIITASIAHLPAATGPLGPLGPLTGRCPVLPSCRTATATRLSNPKSRALWVVTWAPTTSVSGCKMPLPCPGGGVHALTDVHVCHAASVGAYKCWDSGGSCLGGLAPGTLIYLHSCSCGGCQPSASECMYVSMLVSCTSMHVSAAMRHWGSTWLCQRPVQCSNERWCAHSRR
jgi:hypothetical protein